MRISSRAAGKIKLADALLFDPGEKPGLVEFLLHPVPHCGTRRRLFPCGKIRRFVSPRLAALRLLARSTMRVLRCLVDVSICRGFCESTTRILYPTGSKIPRPNISYLDDNWSIYRGLAASHNVRGDCHFLRCGCRPGSIQEHKKTMKSGWCANQNDKKILRYGAKISDHRAELSTLRSAG